MTREMRIRHILIACFEITTLLSPDHSFFFLMIQLNITFINQRIHNTTDIKYNSQQTQHI